VFTVDKDIVGPFILDDARTWQMFRRSEISLLFFCAVLLRPEKLKLLGGIAVNCNLSLMQGWSKEMSSLQRALLQIDFSLVRICKPCFRQLFRILAAYFHTKEC
jgi:hypothetical protein